MSNTIQITLFILKRMIRKPSSLLIHFLIPLISVILMSQVYNLVEEETSPIYIVNESNDIISRTYTDILGSIPKVQIEFLDSDLLNDKTSLTQDMIIHIEKDFSTKNLSAISIYESRESHLSKAVKGFTRSFTQEVQASGLEGYDLSLSIKNHFKFDPEYVDDLSRKKSLVTSVYGIYLLLLLLTSCLISFKILKEKEMGTFYRIGLSPIHPKIYVLANILANLFLAGIQVILVLISVKLFSNIEFYTSVFNMFLILMTFALCSVSIGVLIATSVSSSNTAHGVMGLILSPSCMLAGCMWPIEYMPDILQRLAYLMPQRWLLDAINAAQRYGKLHDAFSQIFIVLCFSLFFFLIAVYQLRKKSTP